MRGIGLIIVVAIASFGAIASAEKVKTNQVAKLLNHPGEQGAVLLHLKEGQTMTLLSEEGRWLKVRVQGRTGFVPRSKVDMPDNTELARTTRRRPFVDGRGTRRGFDSTAGPDDRVGADALGDSATKDGDDDDGAKKPAAKKPVKTSGDDDDDDTSAKKPVAKKPVKSSGDDDDDDTSAKKPVKKPAPAAKKAAKGGDDDDDDDTSAKKPAKKPAPAAKKAAKGDDDDDDDTSAKKPAVKKKVATKAAAKKGGDDDDDDDDAKAGKKSGDETAKDDDDANTPKRPEAHVGEKTKIFEERRKGSAVAFVAKPNEKLYIDSSKGEWTTVENDDGDTGWVMTSDLLVDGPSTGASHGKAIDLAARLGVTFIQQGMRSVGSKLTGADLVPDAYNINASAATIAIGGDLLYPMGPKLLLGAELAYTGSKTVGGGIVYMSQSTGFTIHDINARGLAAYDFQRPSGMMLIGHLGLRYRAYLVDGYNSATTNPAKIPQETLAAPTIGAALDMPMLGAKYGLRLGFDTILFGSSVSQTAGLEDGATPTMKDIELNARLTYRWRRDYNIVGAYDLDYGSYDFGAPNPQSTRGHTGTDTTRTDILHMVTVGLAMGF